MQSGLDGINLLVGNGSRTYSGKGTKGLIEAIEKNKVELERLILSLRGFVSYSLVRTKSSAAGSQCPSTRTRPAPIGGGNENAGPQKSPSADFNVLGSEHDQPENSRKRSGDQSIRVGLYHRADIKE